MPFFHLSGSKSLNIDDILSSKHWKLGKQAVIKGRFGPICIEEEMYLLLTYRIYLKRIDFVVLDRFFQLRKSRLKFFRQIEGRLFAQLKKDD